MRSFFSTSALQMPSSLEGAVGTAELSRLARAVRLVVGGTVAVALIAVGAVALAAIRVRGGEDDVLSLVVVDAATAGDASATEISVRHAVGGPASTRYVPLSSLCIGLIFVDLLDRTGVSVATVRVECTFADFVLRGRYPVASRERIVDDVCDLLSTVVDLWVVGIAGSWLWVGVLRWSRVAGLLRSRVTWRLLRSRVTWWLLGRRIAWRLLLWLQCLLNNAFDDLAEDVSGVGLSDADSGEEGDGGKLKNALGEFCDGHDWAPFGSRWWWLASNSRLLANTYGRPCDALQRSGNNSWKKVGRGPKHA